MNTMLTIQAIQKIYMKLQTR